MSGWNHLIEQTDSDVGFKLYEDGERYMTDWKAYLKMLKKKMWLVILITLIFTAGTAYYSLYKIEPLYEANTKLFVLTYQPDANNRLYYDDLMASQALVTNYQELIKSRAIISEVIKKLNLTDTSDKKLVTNIDAELIPNTSMLSVTVRHEDPYLVADIANELSAIFIGKLNAITKTPNISMVDKATVSEKPVFPRTTLFIALGFFIGFILSLGLILLVVFFDDTIGSLEEIETRTGLRVIGVVPDIDKVRG